MAEIARRTTLKNNRVLFLIHRKEVLDQAIKTFKEQGVNSDLLTAGMVQTLTRRVDKLSEPQLILIDEAHHALAKSYQNILKKFPNTFVLLFTATPIRTGRQQLDLIADDIIVGQSIQELTEKGFLAPFRYFQPPNDFDVKQLKKSSTGDYTKDSMDKALSNKLFGHIVKQYKRIANGKQAVVYAHSIDAALKITTEFNEAGISASEVDGTTPKDKREEIVQRFRDQELKILVNVNLFTEGVDLPNVDCVIMARPTASLALYLQFSMRCLNPRPGKTAIIIDHANNFKKFGYPDDERDWKSAMTTGSKSKKLKESEPTFEIATCDYCFAVVKASQVKDGKCPICGNPIKVSDKAKEVADVDLIERSKERKKVIEDAIHDQIMTNVVNKSVNELKSYAELKAYQKLHGFKPGWVYIMAKKKGIFK